MEVVTMELAVNYSILTPAIALSFSLVRLAFEWRSRNSEITINILVFAHPVVKIE